MKNNSPNIFALGLSKTGSNSLTTALEILNYKTIHFPNFSYVQGKCEIHPEILEKYDAFTDTPVAASYPELDKAYPGSKFILTLRDKKTWLRSCKRHFWKGRFDNNKKGCSNDLHRQLYGHTYFEHDKFSKNYDQHRDRVTSYFKVRENDLLIMNIIAGDGWEKLCHFLDKPVPKCEFPAKNVTTYEEKADPP